MEKVYVENEWYDGPRKGVADFRGVPHRFIANFEDKKGYLDSFNIFPISESDLKLEIEQWKIYVEWNKKYESGSAAIDSHPGHGGINQRWDEIEKLLQSKRDLVPECAILAYANFERINQENRYDSSGPDYGVVWKVEKA